MQLASSGGRRLRHAALAARRLVLETEHTVTRKELSAAAREAEKALRLSATQRIVLGQLVACWGEQKAGRLLVWPSNARLVATTGLSERSIRNVIRALIDLRLVVPKDSPNGKRYAIRDEAGVVVDAFGFDLTPIYARRGEWAETIAQQKRLKDIRKRTFDEITICRRATEEALSALAQHFPEVDRLDLEQRMEVLKARTPRRSGSSLPEGLADAWQEARYLAEDAFYKAGCDGTECRHIEAESGSPSETCDNSTDASQPRTIARSSSTQISPALVVEACPVISYYGHVIRNAADVVSAGRYLRASLGAHPSTWDEAVRAIGDLSAAAAVIYVLQLYDDDVASGRNRIRNAGGYYRFIVRMISRGGINLQAELLALRRRKLV
ncbi:helix-turn-helix domain-containing protein [Microvirga sp. HBU67558]|uniref:plasmid replication protein RepC n=1 Tax=Microvirga TaxID=186650 RepID=UPI001B39C672|nr:MULTISPECIES: plasmid replication protein RepC [unclassified Microvirga]MBQ0822686.1 helix-turn-helix domain-containing protein [Microvirga sp. HBU67558]